MASPPPVVVEEGRRLVPADYAGLECVVEAEEWREGMTLVGVYCPQLECRDQLSFEWGPRRERKTDLTPAEIEAWIRQRYIPSLAEAKRRQGTSLRGKRFLGQP